MEALKVVKKERKQRHQRKAKPIYIAKLVETMGGGKYEKVADLLGVMRTTIGLALKNNECSYSLELAAKGQWEIRYGMVAKKEKNSQRVAIITAEGSDLSTIEKFVISIGGKYHLVP